MEWKISDSPVDYEAAIQAMEARVDGILSGKEAEQVWLLEHPPLYTAGTSAKPSDVLEAKFPIHTTGRGGQHTYHGPGQRIAYVMLDLKRRSGKTDPDLRKFVQQLEQWLIATLADFGVESFTREGRIGVWTIDDKGREAKIAALGIRVRKWVTYHGIALNHSPDLSHYEGIVPCGIANYGVTSLKALGISASMHELDGALKINFEKIF